MLEFRIFFLVAILFILASCEDRPHVLEGPFFTEFGIKYDQKTRRPVTGSILTYRENGQLEFKEDYRNGVPHGVHEYFFENGQLEKRKNYKSGQTHGVEESFFKNGKRRSIIHYKNGLPNGQSKTFFDTGNPRYEGNVIKGVAEGIHTRYSERTGFVVTKAGFKNGLLNGKCQSYYRNKINNGVINFQGHFINNVPHGSMEWFRKDGSLHTKIEYIKGEKSNVTSIDVNLEATPQIPKSDICYVDVSVNNAAIP